jgi:hypothetical protein
MSNEIPDGHCKITLNGEVIYTGTVTGEPPNDMFMGGIGDTIIVHPNDYDRIKSDCMRADALKG